MDKNDNDSIYIHPNNYNTNVQVCIINEDGKFLIQKRSNTEKYYANKWSFVGGGALNDESAINACVREVKEELRIWYK